MDFFLLNIELEPYKLDFDITLSMIKCYLLNVSFQIDYIGEGSHSMPGSGFNPPPYPRI